RRVLAVRLDAARNASGRLSDLARAAGVRRRHVCLRCAADQDECRRCGDEDAHAHEKPPPIPFPPAGNTRCPKKVRRPPGYAFAISYRSQNSASVSQSAPAAAATQARRIASAAVATAATAARAK